MTRSRISSETLLGSLRARETVMVETPARLATSRMRAPLPLILFFGGVGCPAAFAAAVASLPISPSVTKRTGGVKRAADCSNFAGTGIR
jgi:hypothetical protein